MEARGQRSCPSNGEHLRPRGEKFMLLHTEMLGHRRGVFKGIRVVCMFKAIFYSIFWCIQERRLK